MNGRNDGTNPMQRSIRGKAEGMRTELIQLAATATKLAEELDEVLQEKGGLVQHQPKINFITGAYARILKDAGVVEHLQSLGVTIKPIRRT